MNIKFLTIAGFLLFIGSKATAQCSAATNLSHQFANGVNTFSWDPVSNASQYELMIVESNAFAAPELLTITSANSFSTPGGVLSATYDYWVITTCQNGDNATSTPFTFTIPCPEPTNLTTTNLSETSVTLNWSNPYATDPMYERPVVLAYRPIGGSWITLSSGSYASSYVLSNLTPGTAYEWCVNLNCPYFDSAPVFGNFTTLNPPCPPVQSMNVLDITNTSAKLNWSVSSGVHQSYTIQYKQTGSATWTTITTPNSNSQYTLTGLSLDTQYEWKIAANCSYGQSAYSPTGTFVTNCVDMNTSASYIQYAQVKTVTRSSGADPNGYFNYFVPVDAQAGSTVTVKVRAGFVGGNSAHNFAIYLDQNRNERFEANEKVGGNYYIGNASLKTYNITVPANTALGYARLRLVLLKQNQGISMNACVPVGALGETEDYWLNITAPVSFAQDAGSDAEKQPTEIESRNNDDYQASEIVLAPNPTSGDFTIQSNIGLASYSIFNADGLVIAKQTLEGAPLQVSVTLEVVPDGIYFVKITDIYGVSTIHKLSVL